MGAVMFLALALGAIRLGGKAAQLMGRSPDRGRNRDREVFGGIVGVLVLLVLAALIFQLEVIPKDVVAAQLRCPWLKGCR
jgi:hypothetical protein